MDRKIGKDQQRSTSVNEFLLAVRDISWPQITLNFSSRAAKKISPQKTSEIDTNYDCWQGNK